MDNVNKTLYIPLYGRSYVSKRGLFLSDKKACEIWESEGFSLRGKSKSKWLAYYMGIRSAVFDEWLKEKMREHPDTTVIHIGCGMDSRVLRVGTMGHKWYDVDFEDVIRERVRYFEETCDYKMLAADARESKWLDSIPESAHATVVMEGVSMYMALEDLRAVTARLCQHFEGVSLLMDCYTSMAARLSKYRNPINDVGVTEVYGIDQPRVLEQDGFELVSEHNMTPESYIEELSGMEKRIFKGLYAGKFAKKLYRLFEYKMG